MSRFSYLAVILAASQLLCGKNLAIGPGSGSSMELIVEKTGLMSGKKHLFVFEKFDGKIRLDEQKLSGSEVTLRIDAASIVCKDTWVSEKDRDKIVKAALEDMLAATKHPTVSFQSTGIAEAGPERFIVDGTLTLRGISKPARVTVTRAGDAYKGDATIKLTDYGLKPPSAALGAVGTKNEMQFSFSLTPKAE